MPWTHTLAEIFSDFSKFATNGHVSKSGDCPLSRTQNSANMDSGLILSCEFREKEREKGSGFEPWRGYCSLHRGRGCCP